MVVAGLGVLVPSALARPTPLPLHVTVRDILWSLVPVLHIRAVAVIWRFVPPQTANANTHSVLLFDGDVGLGARIFLLGGHLLSDHGEATLDAFVNKGGDVLKVWKKEKKHKVKIRENLTFKNPGKEMPIILNIKITEKTIFFKKINLNTYFATLFVEQLEANGNFENKCWRVMFNGGKIFVSNFYFFIV